MHALAASTILFGISSDDTPVNRMYSRLDGGDVMCLSIAYTTEVIIEKALSIQVFP